MYYLLDASMNSEYNSWVNNEFGSSLKYNLRTPVTLLSVSWTFSSVRMTWSASLSNNVLNFWIAEFDPDNL